MLTRLLVIFNIQWGNSQFLKIMKAMAPEDREVCVFFYLFLVIQYNKYSLNKLAKVTMQFNKN